MVLNAVRLGPADDAAALPASQPRKAEGRLTAAGRWYARLWSSVCSPVQAAPPAPAKDRAIAVSESAPRAAARDEDAGSPCHTGLTQT
ncbi:hypothetical protein OG607_02595 [Streptomyces sp. NBC_01537]|uniref:hypothetical protein n=1 Tax=Streptomyces sp. NBC_01537 TaxID=2903896 RepID=UPI003869DF24